MARLRRMILAVLLLATLAACAGEATPTPPPSATVLGGNGTLVLTLGDDPTTLDPPLIGDVSSAFVARQLYSGLVRMNNDLEAEPDLAESIDISPDGLVYTFRLRADAAFADGTPITADDVRWSLERATDPTLGPIVAATYLNDIDGIQAKLSGESNTLRGLEVIDERTIAIRLGAPSALFLLKISNPPAFVVDRRAVAQGGDWFEQPNGSGPFMIDSWDRRRRMELVVNPAYRGPAPKLSRITLLLGAEGSNPLGLYEAGQIDLAPIGAYDLDRVSVASDPLNGDLRETPQLALSYVAFNTALPPFDDPKVREAFALLIDRSKLAEVSYNGTVVAARGILPPGMPGADPASLPEPSADIERARQLIAESSYGSIEALPPLVGYVGGDGVGLLSEIAYDELGVAIDLRGQERFGDYLTALFTDEFHLYDMSWIADYPDPQNFLEVLFGAEGQYNFTNYDDPEFERLLDEAQAEQDDAARGALYREAERRLLESHVVVPLYHSVDYSLVKPYVEGLVITPQGLIDLTTVSLRR